MPSLQISFILPLTIPRRQPDASLPHRHHARRNDVPQIQRDNVRRHKINLLQDMQPPLPRRHVTRIRSRLRPSHRRLHLHPVRDPILFHHQVIRSRIPPQLRHPKPLLHRPRQKPHLRPLSPLLGILKLTPALSHRSPLASKSLPKTRKARPISIRRWRPRPMSFSGSGALRQLHDDCHPERSRFSGVAKDLPLRRPNA